MSDLKATEWTRETCTSCKRRFKFYCPYCYVVLGKPENVAVPSVLLPLKIDVIFRDNVKKSTSVHAKVLGEGEINIIPFPESEIPAYNPAETAVVYPSEDAVTFPEMKNLKDLKKLIFLDASWQKAPVILTDPSLKKLPVLKLAKPPRLSQYWRYHSAGGGCISTIEAMHQMLVEYLDAIGETEAKIESMDKLLFFFNLLKEFIIERHHSDPAKKGRENPMNEEEKERHRKTRYQKEQGKKKRLENRLEYKRKIEKDLENGVIEKKPKTGRCYNCKDPNHEAKKCPKPCKYCGDPDHWSGGCQKKGTHTGFPQIPKTKA